MSKIHPRTIDIFKYFVTSTFLGITCDKIKNNPKRQNNIMSFPFEDPIKMI